MKRILGIAALSFLLGVPGSAQQPPSAAQEGFVPVDQLPTQESIPAAPLVAGAYAFAWIAVAGYVLSVWRRLNRVERELQVAMRRIEGGGSKGPGRPGQQER